jgi:glucokinase
MTGNVIACPGHEQTIGIDIGGTKIAAGVVSAGGHILHREVLPTPSAESQDSMLDVLGGIIGRLRERYPQVGAIGVGAAGMVEWPNGYIRWAPNNHYHELPLRDLLAELTGLPVVVENDANAAAAAEGLFGSGAGCRDSVTLTVGTGIGGGIILNSQLHRGQAGIGAEVGHLIVNPNHGPPCACGATGCLETMASGTALGRAGRHAAAADPAGVLATLAGGPERVAGETVYNAARYGDPTAHELFRQLGYWLGVGIASLINVLDPQVVILGGGIGVSAGDLVLAPARAAAERFAFARTRRALPPIVQARLGADAGLIGAAILALSQTNRSANAIGRYAPREREA